MSDIDWNPKYNMFALSGFGHQFPVLIYVYQRSEEELNSILYSGAATISATERISEGKKETLGTLSTRRSGKENDGLGVSRDGLL